MVLLVTFRRDTIFLNKDSNDFIIHQPKSFPFYLIVLRTWYEMRYK